MKLFPLLTLIACVSTLTGCAGLTASDRLRAEAAAAQVRKEIGAPPAVDSSLTAECDKAVLLPERKLTQAEITYYWAKDRASLKFCRAGKSGLIEVYRAREGGVPPPAKRRR